MHLLLMPQVIGIVKINDQSTDDKAALRIVPFLQKFTPLLAIEAAIFKMIIGKVMN